MPVESLTPIAMLVPLLGALALLGPAAFLSRPKAAADFALLNTLTTFVLTVIVAFNFDFSANEAAPSGLQMVTEIPWVEAFGLEFSFGIDAVSLWLIMLTTLLMPLVVLGSRSAVHERAREFFFWLLLLESAMIGVFAATNLVFFYICFEFTLIPLFFLIGVFGSGDRLRAARVFFLYTFTGSMLTLAGVVYAAWWNAQLTGEWSFWIPQLVESAQAMSPTQQGWVLAALLAGFAVKVPLFPVHTWLPLAHTEAPTAGSVVLAGVLLKLGTYGLFRFALPMTPEATVAFAPYVAALAVVGILYAALVCWVQRDIKKLIAYSSVSHLGFCVLGLFALNITGVGGSVIYMINHGLSTGALFLCVGMIYERFHTREMAQLNGLAKVMPVWAFFMVFFALASVGLPGLNGFVGEFLTLLGAFQADQVLGPAFAVPAAVGLILAAIYILYMVGKVVFGPLKLPEHDAAHAEPVDEAATGSKPEMTAATASAPEHHASGGSHASARADVSDLSAREIGVLTPLAVLCLVLGLYPAPLLRTLEPASRQVLAPTKEILAARAESRVAPSPMMVVPVEPVRFRPGAVAPEGASRDAPARDEEALTEPAQDEPAPADGDQPPPAGDTTRQTPVPGDQESEDRP